MKYYHIARLRRGAGLEINGESLSVDLDAIGPDDHVTDDVSLRAAEGPDHYFFVSGGGSVLIAGRYLLAVRRHPNALVNPGRLSLFTGRADGPGEWRDPPRVVRELFEELLIMAGGEILRPTCTDFEPVIADVYAHNGRVAKQHYSLRPLALSGGALTVNHLGKVVFSESVFWHASVRNDINLLYLFDADLELDTITAQDGESADHERRMIVALDIKTMRYADISSAGTRNWADASALPMSELLVAVLQRLKPRFGSNEATAVSSCDD